MKSKKFIQQATQQSTYVVEKSKVDIKNNVKTYYNFVKKYKWYFISVAFFVLIAELVGLGDRYLFKIIIDKGTEYANNSLALPVFASILISVALTFGSLLVIKIIARWLRMHLINILEASMIYSLKRKFFDHIVHLSHRFHTTHKTGSLISRLTRGSRAIERITDFLLFETNPLIFQVLVVSSSLYFFDKTTSVIVLLMALSFIAFSVFMSYIQQPANLAANNSDDKEKGTIADIFMNIDSIKYFGKEELIKGKYGKLAAETRQNFIKLWNYARWFEFGQSLMIGIGTFFLLYFPLKSFLAGEMTLGVITFIYTSYLALLGPLYGFVHSIRRTYEALADFQALFDYDKVQNEIKDLPNSISLNVKNGQVEFEKISFAYHSKAVIDNLSLKLKPGEKIALVGHSGSGKTTLVKLLYRFYDVPEGRILIDGRDIKEFKQESLRGELSIVPQECILFDDTIYNNIAFSRPNATRSEVQQAIRFAQLDKFISNLPQKENTIVGERGVKLSGGEKQRVSIARAILADKKILVLDEATSSLDSQTEHEIQLALQKLMQNRTSLIIAHRLSTIMNSDRIVVLDKGKVSQIGTHAELIRRPGIYKKLWNLQKGGYIGE
jgi:ATP-binding cassette subfamily B protein